MYSRNYFDGITYATDENFLKAGGMHPLVNGTLNLDVVAGTWTDSKSNVCGKEYQPQVVPKTYQSICEQPNTAKIDAEDNPDGLDRAEDYTTTSGIAYPLFDAVADFMDKVAVYGMLENDPTIKTSSTILSAFYMAQQNGNIRAIREAEEAMAKLLDSLSQNDSSVYFTRLAQATVANGLIVNNGNFYENCERKTSEIQAQIINTGLASLDNDQRLYIAALAQQCPAATGYCVYKARSIAAALNPGVQYADNAACSALLPQNKNAQNPYEAEQAVLDGLTANAGLTAIALHTLLIYPNPVEAGNYVTLRYNFVETDKVECKLTDITGKQVQNTTLAGGDRKVELAIADLARGIYTIEIRVNEQKVHSQLLQVR
jgi:hypothetical protein